MAKYAVLIIDDEEHILELMEYNLSTNGFKVFTATCIKEADEILKNEKIDLVLLDIMLPDLDGMSALKKYRQDAHTKNIPIIMVTAKAEEIDKIIGLELGADCPALPFLLITALILATTSLTLKGLVM